MQEKPHTFRVLGETVSCEPGQMARLLRHASQLGLGAEICHGIREAILATLAAPPPPPSDNDRAGKEGSEISQVASHSAAHVSKLTGAELAGPAELDLRLRQLVEQDAAWSEIAQLAWTLFHLTPDGERGARLVELAYLHGQLTDVAKVLATLLQSRIGFYGHLNRELRQDMFRRLWCAGETDVLQHCLTSLGDESQRLAIEHLFFFWSAMHGHDNAQPFIYFQRYEEQLCQAASRFGAAFNLGSCRFNYLIGKLGVELGFEATSRRMLEKIDRESPEYGSALELLLKVKVERDDRGQSAYASQIFAEKDWRARLRLLRNYMTESLRLGAFRDRNRAAVNELLKDPLQWLPAQPQPWQALSEVLVEFAHLSELLPCVFDTFRSNAMVFHRSDLDTALWQPVLHEFRELSESVVEEALANTSLSIKPYWRGVALIHHYIARGPEHEACLWQAKYLIEAAEGNRFIATPFSWHSLHRAALQCVHKALHLHEQDRTMMLRQLKVASDPRLLSVSDVQEYLDSSKTPDYGVLENIQYIARNHGKPEMELRVLRRKVLLTHVTNRDIDRFWQLGLADNEFDLAWRAATVAHTRQSLRQVVVHPWCISGERRSDYPFLSPTFEEVIACQQGFSNEQSRLVMAILRIGPAIPELLSCLDAGARSLKVATPPPDSPAQRVHKFLASLRWLPAPKRIYQFSHERLVDSDVQLPAFIDVLPTNTWSLLLVQLSSRLGINSWGWKLSKLRYQIEDLIPRLAVRQDLARHSTKVARWLKQLGPQERSAWQDLAHLSGKLTDQQAQDCLAAFLIRLAVTIYPNHEQALLSLRMMRADVPLVWQAENWVLSDSYSEFRKSRKINIRVPVPKSLRQMSSIIGATSGALGHD